MSDLNNRLADNPFARYLGYLVSTPVDMNLALDILDRLFWTKCPKPNIMQKTVADLTREIYKLLNLGYLNKHQFKKRYKYTVSLTQKGINFLNYETASDEKKLELKFEWGAWYISNELEIKEFIIKELLIK